MASISAEFHRIHDKARPVIGTMVYGLVAGFAAVAFQLALNWLYKWCYQVPATGIFFAFRSPFVRHNHHCLTDCGLVTLRLLSGSCGQWHSGSKTPFLEGFRSLSASNCICKIRCRCDQHRGRAKSRAGRTNNTDWEQSQFNLRGDSWRIKAESAGGECGWGSCGDGGGI